MRIAIFFLLLCLLLPDNSAGNDIYTFNKITTNDGLSHSTVYTITQDHKGIIWIGTREGLNRYDSYGITTYYAEKESSSSLSSNEITSVLATKDSSLYIGTANGLNLYNYEKDKMQDILFEGKSLGLIHQLFESSDNAVYICSSKGLFILTKQHEIKQLMNNRSVLAINEYKDNVFWLATPREIILVNQKGEVIKFYPYLKRSKDELLSTADNISCIFKDNEGEIWIGTRKNGLYKYVAKKDLFQPIVPDHKDNPIEVNVVKSLGEDSKGNIWIGTESGLFIYNKKLKKFSHYSQSFDNSSHTLNDKAIYAIYRSKEDIMWIGTYFGGVNFVKPEEKGFYRLVPDGGENSLSGKAISQIIKDKQGKIWIATEDGGITIYDKNKGEFEYQRHLVDNTNSISCNNVHALQDDGRGNIWIGTLLGGLNKYSLKDKKFTVYKHIPGDTTSISHNNVFSVLKDSRGILWVGTWNGVNIYDYKTNSFSKFETENFSNRFIYDMLEDHQGNIWFCSRNDGLFMYDVMKKEVSRYHINNSRITSNAIVCAYQDSKNRLWFGSLNGGLIRYNRRTNEFISTTKKDGLANNNVYGILEDDQGNLWVSTNRGLSKCNPETGEITSFNNSQGISNHQFNFKSFLKDDDGSMYFGSVNGLYYFHPDSLTFNQLPPKVHFTDFKLFNKTVKANDNGLLTAHINETDEITLDYEQNVITFEFLGINYFSPGNNTFSYYLEGFEQDWSIPAGKRTATYTNLSPGTYTFHVKAANNDGIWSEEKKIGLVVLPPLWLSDWALVIYVLLAILSLYCVRSYIYYRHREKMAFQLERVEKENMRELNQHKLNFFTYISHEFKTPLTLIIASIDRFLNTSIRSSDDNQEFHLIKRNARRLHFLIEQLMEFRKIETDHATLNINKGDIVLFLNDTFSAFIPLFSKKNIDYHLVSSHSQYITYFDADKLEKIITNLVSNAVKNTPEYGEISLGIDFKAGKNTNNTCIRIKLTDSGVGMGEEEIEKVFSPFYQSNHEKLYTPGSGVGLALVKSLIDYLKGEIKVVSTVEKGTTVTIDLPCMTDIGSNDEVNAIEGNKNLSIDQDLFNEEDDLAGQKLNGKDAASLELMVVEDNRELLKFLVNHFSGSYKTISARNGQEALDKMQKNMPDIIISDVMMPLVDGISLCEKIKSDLNTSHIPLILLTAKSSMPNKLEALDVGADAYLPKPFNLKELELTIKNILESRKCLKNHFLKFASLSEYEAPMNNRDQSFINNLTDIVHQFIDDSEFNIGTFTKEAGVSRTLLHLKLKKLVNLNASDFIKTIRLQKSTELLKEGLTVSEVAFRVGFKDPNYFSRSFKEKYNITPSDFRGKDEPVTCVKEEA